MSRLLLFFDDQALENRENLSRDYGPAVLDADSVYHDPSGLSLCGGLPNVFFHEKEYWMLYNMLDADSDDIFLCAAHSPDARAWQPLDTTRLLEIPGRKLRNQIFPLCSGETGCVYQDLRAPREERYKLFYCRYDLDALRVRDEIFVSPDCLAWRRLDTTWNPDGAEPGMGCFYSPARETYMITTRPHWAERRICITETADWRTFSPVTLAVQADSLDAPLCETYGMPVFEYENYAIGLLWLYFNPPGSATVADGVQAINESGRMYPELVYSLNGTHFQRSLRKPFLHNGTPDAPSYGCIFANSMLVQGEQLRIFAACSQNEHGGFRTRGLGCIASFTLKKDRFIFLESNGVGRLRTRNLLINGDLCVNAQCSGRLLFQLCDDSLHPVEGFSFADCDVFRGDETDHLLSWHGRTARELKGRSLKLEFWLEGGRIYAVKGDFLLLGFNQNRLYNRFGIVPDRKGF